MDDCVQLNVDVYDWLYCFCNASYIVTDSFHGTVFSILFGKEFYSMCAHYRGLTRIYSLLNRLGLESRIVSDTAPVEPAVRDIDWSSVHDQLDVYRRESLDFLREALS